MFIYILTENSGQSYTLEIVSLSKTSINYLKNEGSICLYHRIYIYNILLELK
jgi:hypothetical protein